MKAVCVLFLAAAPVFAQDPPAKPPIIQLRPLELNFKDVKIPVHQHDFTIARTAPGICAIPLLPARGKQTVPMPVLKPNATEWKMPDTKGPAPACLPVR